MQLVQLSSVPSRASGSRCCSRLQELGYYKGVITGAYSGSVVTAVRTFQIFNNLPSVYVTGRQTPKPARDVEGNREDLRRGVRRRLAQVR
jgi:peptidoglycan hydrolase-like protein with peptidoglycan-binding domain